MVISLRKYIFIILHKNINILPKNIYKITFPLKTIKITKIIYFITFDVN